MLTLLLLNKNALPEISGPKLKGHQKLVNRKSKKPLIVKGIIPNGLYTQVNNIDGIESHVVLKVLYVLWKKQLKNMEDNNFKYFPLSREYKIKILNGNKDRYGIFKQLVDRGILYSTSYSTTRNQCKYVRLNPEYTKGEMVEIFYSQYYRVEANVDPSVQKVVEALTKLDLPHKNLSGIQELVKSKRTNIEEKIQSEITVNGKYRNKKIRKTQILFVQDKVKEISNIHITRLYRLLDLKNCYCGRNKTNRRMNHPLTNLPKLYLNHINMDGESMVEIDFICCQPCLLSHIFAMLGFRNQDSWIYRIEYFLYLIKENEEEIDNGELRLEEKYSTHSLCSDLENIVCQTDIKEFMDNTFKGRLYESFVDENNLSNKSDRDKIKKLIWRVIFGQHKYVSQDLRFEVITQRYPNLLNAVEELKKIFKQIEYRRSTYGLIDQRASRLDRHKKSSEKAGNDQLAILLQNLESWLFIDQILPKLQAEGFDVIPRHDSFLVKESHSEQVYKIIHDNLSGILGIDKFSLRIKNLI